MNFWTAHVRRDAVPVLVREGFSWGALLFGPLWLAVHRAWIPAVLVIAGCVLIVTLSGEAIATILLLGLMVLMGLSGQDLRRWSLGQRGYLLSQVVAARSELEALEQLLIRRPDIRGSFLPPGAVR